MKKISGRHLFYGLLYILFASLCITPNISAQALGQDDLNSIYNDTVWYQTGTSCFSGGTILSGADNEEKVWNYFVGKGLSDKQTAGIMGNIQQESSFDPLRMQKGGKSQDPYDAGDLGWGLIQWSGNGTSGHSTGDKVTSLYKASGLGGPISELGTQLDLVWGHMQNKPPITRGDFSLNDFRAITDERQAALYFLAHIEAGTDPDGIRETNASKILQKYSGKSGSNTSGGPSCGSDAVSGSCGVNNPVYEGQYSPTQLAQIFGDPGTEGSHPDLHLVSVTFQDHSAQVSPIVAPCLKAVSQEIDAMNVDYSVNQFGCYRFDSDNGSSNIGLKSYHTYGAACDINWNTNKYVDCDCDRPYDMPQAYTKAFDDHGFTWGGNWTHKRDYMHFEWHGIIP